MPALSVTVTSRTRDVLVLAVGVPLTTPVSASMTSPGGRFDTLYEAMSVCVELGVAVTGTPTLSGGNGQETPAGATRSTATERCSAGGDR